MKPDGLLGRKNETKLNMQNVLKFGKLFLSNPKGE